MQHVAHIIKTELGYTEYDFHSLRRIHATELREAGVSIKAIQRRPVHSTMVVQSKRYLHDTELIEDQSVKLMNGMQGCPEKPSGEDRQRGILGNEINTMPSEVHDYPIIAFAN